MPKVLAKYAKSKGLKLEGTTEESLNIILENLNNEEKNITHGEFRSELISACAVALNGLGRIKDPVRLYKNLTQAFERRGICIYTKTVSRAFNRLYLDAVKQGKADAVLSVWERLRNLQTKAFSCKYVPLESIKKLIKEQKKVHSFNLIFDSFAMRRFGEEEKQFLEGLLKDQENLIRKNASRLLVSMGDKLDIELLKNLMKSDAWVSYGASQGLAERTDKSNKFILNLTMNRDRKIASAAITALEYRNQIKFYGDNFSEARENLSGISGKRGHRRREMRRRTAPLRSPPSRKSKRPK